MTDVAMDRLTKVARESQEMLQQTLDQLSQEQGARQACEEIIRRTRQVVEDFRGKDQISNLAGSALLEALGPVV